MDGMLSVFLIVILVVLCIGMALGVLDSAYDWIAAKLRR